jgi:hypothetical protein
MEDVQMALDFLELIQNNHSIIQDLEIPAKKQNSKIGPLPCL